MMWTVVACGMLVPHNKGYNAGAHVGVKGSQLGLKSDRNVLTNMLSRLN